MQKTILILNSGSSSIKYKLYDMDDESVLASGLVERIGEAEGKAYHRVRGENGIREIELSQSFTDHRQAFDHIFGVLGNPGLSAIGHRVVHGGEQFHCPVLIDDEVIEVIRANIPLAPLHNPSNLLGIEIARELYTDTPQVAVFDTAFHQTLPAVAWCYAVPREWYERHHVRRYGFHGTSHAYVAKVAARLMGRPLESLNLITLHLGNGASITALREGRSVDTSMGMTPLEGLIMGTRSGDLDPSIVFYLERTCGLGAEEVERLLNHESGLKGICGSNDMRAIHKAADAGDHIAQLAIDMFCYRIRKYIGAYLAVLGKVDALVFTGGIGENDPLVREQVCKGLEGLGLVLDPGKNQRRCKESTSLHGSHGPIAIYRIPTDEELEIARQTLTCIEDGCG